MNSVVVLLLTLRSNGSRKLIHLCGLEILYSLNADVSSLLPLLGSHRSILCFYQLDHLRYCM